MAKKIRLIKKGNAERIAFLKKSDRVWIVSTHNGARSERQILSPKDFWDKKPLGNRITLANEPGAWCYMGTPPAMEAFLEYLHRRGGAGDLDECTALIKSYNSNL